MSYRHSPLADTAPGTAEAVSGWNGHTMGGRVPAFIGLAQRAGGGVFFENPPSLDSALTQTGLDFEVKLEELRTVVHEPQIVDGEPTTQEVAHELPNHRATVAHFADGRVVPFGPVGTRYRPIQNTAAAELGQAIVDSGEGSLLAVGSYGDPIGCRTYMAFDLGQFTVGGQDGHNLALTILNSHDGSSGMTSLAAPVRVACTNQVSGIFGRRKNARHTIRHTENANGRVAEIRAALELTHKYVELYVEQAEQLLAAPMGTDDFVAWERELFNVPTELGEATRYTQTATANRDEVLVKLFTGDTNEFGRGTRYAAAQTLIEYLDHESTVRGGDPEAKRWERIMAGQTEGQKARAWESLLVPA